MNTNQKAMTAIMLLLSAFTLFALYLIISAPFYPAPPSHAIHITNSNTDERGLTCIQFTQDGQEWALDFLTTHELDSIKNVK